MSSTISLVILTTLAWKDRDKSIAFTAISCGSCRPNAFIMGLVAP